MIIKTAGPQPSLINWDNVENVSSHERFRGEVYLVVTMVSEVEQVIAHVGERSAGSSYRMVALRVLENFAKAATQQPDLIDMNGLVADAISAFAPKLEVADVD